LWVETITEVEEQFKDEGKRTQQFRNDVSEQEDMEKESKDNQNPKARDIAAKMAELKGKSSEKEAEYEFRNYVPYVDKYIAEHRDTQKYYSGEKFKVFLRREKGVYKRKFIDKVDNYQVVFEEVRLFKTHESGAIVYVPDIDPKAETYIVCYRDAAGGG